MDNVYNIQSMKDHVASIKLGVQVVGCDNLPQPEDGTALPNPFVSVDLHGIVRRTKAAKATRSPIFVPLHSSFDFLLFFPVVDRQGARLNLTVWHQGSEGHNEILGRVTLEPWDWFPWANAGSTLPAFAERLAFEDPDNKARDIALKPAGSTAVGFSGATIKIKLGLLYPPLREAAGNFAETFAVLLARARRAPIAEEREVLSEMTKSKELLAAPPDSIDLFPPSRAALDSIAGENVLHHSDMNVRVVRLSPGVIVKYGGGYIAQEIEAQEFASLHTAVPMPRILYKPPDPMWCLVTEEVEGVTLESCLELMEEDHLDDIIRQLRHIIRELRGITRQPTTLGHVDGGPYRNPWFWIPPENAFETVQEFNDYWKELLSRFSLPDRVESLISRLPTDDPIVFCHGDLTPRNIIVQGSTIKGIIDWGLAAWYPEYWEYMQMRVGANWSEKWKYVVQAVVTPKEKEAGAMQTIISNIYFNL